MWPQRPRYRRHATPVTPPETPYSQTPTVPSVERFPPPLSLEGSSHTTDSATSISTSIAYRWCSTPSHPSTTTSCSTSKTSSASSARCQSHSLSSGKPGGTCLSDASRPASARYRASHYPPTGYTSIKSLATYAPRRTPLSPRNDLSRRVHPLPSPSRPSRHPPLRPPPAPPRHIHILASGFRLFLGSFSARLSIYLASSSQRYSVSSPYTSKLSGTAGQDSSLNAHGDGVEIQIGCGFWSTR